MGKTASASTKARANIEAWTKELQGGGLDAIVSNTSGCGTMLKDYGHIFRDDKIWSTHAAKVSDRVLDISEFLTRLDISSPAPSNLSVAYHSACSLQHGQQVHEAPKSLLEGCGFKVLEIPEGHLCCGSAGTYNLLQPAIASSLRDRKLENIATVAPDVIAAGNIGCITQLSSGTNTPVVHTVQLVDWATGGPKPKALGSTA
jgi:glycolate oxidase iron-sulfur subunit